MTNTKTSLNQLFFIFNAINLFFLIFWADFKWSWEMNGVLTGWERPEQILLEFLQRRRTRRLPIITAYKICAANPEPETHNPLWNTISTSWNTSSTQNLRIRSQDHWAVAKLWTSGKQTVIGYLPNFAIFFLFFLKKLLLIWILSEKWKWKVPFLSEI